MQTAQAPAVSRPTDTLIAPTFVKVGLPENLRSAVDSYAEVVGLSRSAILRIAVAEFFRGRPTI